MTLLVLLLACTDGDGDSAAPATTVTECADAPGATWASFGDGFFAFYCRGCHAAETPDRYGAPEDVNFDTREDLRLHADRVRVRVLDEATMPVGGGVYPDDLVLLDVLLRCGL